MAARALWRSYLKLSLVSVPVRAYTASAPGGGKIHLNQLHEECHSRIRYQKTCPIHGPLEREEIVSGYEYTKGQYVVVEPEELEKFRTPRDHAVNVERFIPADRVDPLFHSGKTYYLVPDGPVGQKPYGLIRQVMVDRRLHGVAQAVISGREHLVLVRPIGKLLALSVLEYAAEVRKPQEFESEVADADMSEEEQRLAGTLIEALAKPDFDFEQYHDTYTQRLTELIQAKVEGREVVAPPQVEEPQVINLMDALKESVRRASEQPAAEEAPTTRRAARRMPERTKRAAQGERKRKRG